MPVRSSKKRPQYTVYQSAAPGRTKRASDADFKLYTTQQSSASFEGAQSASSNQPQSTPGMLSTTVKLHKRNTAGAAAEVPRESDSNKGVGACLRRGALLILGAPASRWRVQLWGRRRGRMTYTCMRLSLGTKTPTCQQNYSWHDGQPLNLAQ